MQPSVTGESEIQRRQGSTGTRSVTQEIYLLGTNGRNRTEFEKPEN